MATTKRRRRRVYLPSSAESPLSERIQSLEHQRDAYLEVARARLWEAEWHRERGVLDLWADSLRKAAAAASAAAIWDGEFQGVREFRDTELARLVS